MADEWACDCGYITSAEPEGEKCPSCGSKMSKIVGVDDAAEKDKDSYDDAEMATPIDEEFDWDESKEDVEESGKPLKAHE